MVWVTVRDQDTVDRADRVGIRRWTKSAQRAEPSAENGISEKAHAIELDQDRRVPEVGKA